MSGTPRPWLPEPAIDAGIDRSVAAATRDWSARWLPAGALRPLARHAPADPESWWQVTGDGVALGMADGARDALGRALLSASADAVIAGAADRQAINGLVDVALRDLGARIAGSDRAASAIAQHRPTLDDARQRLLGLDHRPLVTCLIGNTAAVAMARPRSRRTTRPGLPPLAAALAPQPVTIAARVGGCTLTLADLAALEPGDVVLLDRPVGDAVDLTVAEHAPPLARCTVQSGPDRLALKLLESIDR